MWYWFIFEEITYMLIVETQIYNFIIHGLSISTNDEKEK
jgi:hypothetical protein